MSVSNFRRRMSSTFSRFSNHYELLASNDSSRRHSRRQAKLWCLRTRLRVVILSVLVVTPLCLILTLNSGPKYEDVRLYEERLPQHDTSKLEQGRYLRFEGMLTGKGFNNILQESVLLSYLAYNVNRSFVFQDYQWAPKDPFTMTISDWSLRPARIPLNAFISGPTAGAPTGDTNALAVSLDFFNRACPQENRVHVPSTNHPVDGDATEILRWWTDKLNEPSFRDEKCIVIQSQKKIFDMYVFGSQRVLTSYATLKASPILKNWSWSPLILSAITRNFLVFQPESVRALADGSFTLQQPLSPTSSTLKGLLALHLRRGDYIEHCHLLPEWRTEYMGYNQHPDLPDRFSPTEYESRSDANATFLIKRAPADAKTTSSPWPPPSHPTNAQIIDHYLEHCLPTVSQLVARLQQIRKEYPGLKRVYVMTNAENSFLNELEERLAEDGWGVDTSSSSNAGGSKRGRLFRLTSTKDLVLDDEQFYVSGAIDMAIAEKAEVFVGNGFSSLTSNIVMLRLARGIDPRTNRFL